MTLEGIDISHWQTGLSIAKADPDFAIMKATDGLTYVDVTCDGFVSQCKATGTLFGVYHFAQNTGSLNAEADHFVAAVRGYLGDGILVLDWEHGDLGNVSGAKAWLDRVYAKTGIRPLIYMSQSVAASHNWSSVARDYALWVARYGSSYGDTGAFGHPAMWQYTSSGHVSGYGGSVDKNHFYGDRAAWSAFASGDAPPSPDPTPPTEDDMPTQTSSGYTTDHDIDADGQWQGVKIADDDEPGSAFTLITGPALATGTLSVQLQGPAGRQVLLRTVHSDTKAGQDSKIAYTGFAQEVFTNGGTTQIVLPFTEDIGAPAAGWSRALRFQIKVAGGGKVTVVDARARSLSWKA